MPCKVRGGRGACHRKFQDDHPTHDPGHILRRKHQRQPEKGASHVVEAERLQEIAPQIDAPVPQQIARFHRIVHQHVERDLLGRKIMRHRHISMVFDEHGRDRRQSHRHIQQKCPCPTGYCSTAPLPFPPPFLLHVRLSASSPALFPPRVSA